MSGDAPGFEPLATGYYLEALLVDHDELWYSDVVVGGVRRVGSELVLLPDRRWVGGLLRNEDGSLLVSGEGGIAWVDPASGREGILLEGLDGVNEMRADGRGGMYFGTIDLPSIVRGQRPGPSSLYHLAADRTLRRLREGLVFANGLALGADRETLFFNESFSACCAFALAPDGSLGERRVLMAKRDCDGLALDADGNVWVSGFASGDLLCLRPDGTELRRLPLPGAACTNLRFGGPGMRELYVTVVDPAAAAALAHGGLPQRRTSTLFRGRSPVAGAPLARTAFRLR